MAPAVVAHLAAQIGVGADALDGYAWAGRSGRRHRVATATTVRFHDANPRVDRDLIEVKRAMKPIGTMRSGADFYLSPPSRR